MQYQNRTPTEGINYSKEHPLKEFSILLFGLATMVIIAVLAIAFLAERFAPLVPFHLEEKLLAQTNISIGSQQLSETDQQIQQYLQELGDGLAEEMALPAEMKLNIHYSTDATVNAYATLGGNIVIYRGLLERLPHENSLAMVMAHEIAHIKERHPIVSAGRGITVALAIASLAGLSDSSRVTNLISQIGFTTTLGFSRKQERIADAEAIAALTNYYGHIVGADALFVALKEASSTTPPELLSTHPASDERIQSIRDIIAQRYYEEHKLTPLPEFVVNSQRQDKVADTEEL